MNILNFGSINLDYVYNVPHLVQAGETVAATRYACYPGGKGFNQSVALGRAGATVFHAGAIGTDGIWLRSYLASAGVDITHVQRKDGTTGQAFIQVDNATGQNAIVTEGGTNRMITEKDIKDILAQYGAATVLLLQNEVSCIPDILRLAKERKMFIVFNPAPMTPEVLTYPLEAVDMFIVNELEGAGLAGLPADTPPEQILSALRERFPTPLLLITLGAQGSMCLERGEATPIFVPAKEAAAVDTTAAGDCYIGYFLAAYSTGKPVRESMELATAASAVCVTRRGAAISIPKHDEVVL